MKSMSFLYNHIAMDLCNDMEQISCSILINRGYDKEEVLDLSNPLKTLIEHEMFSISARKRKVVCSKELRCPKGYEKALEALTQKIERGEDINPFLSTRREKIDAKDLLLYDWKIHHLHLTNRYNSKGKPTRSDYLLFVRCEDSVMYFIQIYPHHPNPFVKEELIRIIAHNWPELLLPLRLNNGHLTEEITDELRAGWRKNGILSPVEIDSKIYFSSGGGYASDGSSMLAVLKTDTLWDNMKLLEMEILQNQLSIRREMREFIPKEYFSEMLHFRLWKFSCTEISIFETRNRVLMEYNLLKCTCKFIFLGMIPDIRFDNIYGKQAFPYWIEQAIGGLHA